MRNNLRIGLLGCGEFAKSLTTPFNDLDDANITAVYNRTFSKAEKLGKEIGVPAFPTYEELLAQEFVDGVIINTSHDQHLPMTLAAAASGKHIFCEKPMSLTVSDCDKMIEAASKNNVKLFVGHVTRLLPLFSKMKEVIDSGAIGKLVAVTMTRYYPVKREGWWAKRDLKGGMLHSPASHEIDYLNYLLGDALVVYAVTAPKIQQQLDYPDTMFVTVKYTSGAIGSITSSLSSGFPVQAGFVIGDRGALQYDMYGPDGGQFFIKSEGQEIKKEVVGDFGLPIAMKREARMFVDWVLYDSEPMLTAECGRRTVEIMQAAYKSAEERRPIQLPLRS